eukprot:354239-Chlamydomonas_euryale.AAC.2
MAQAVFCPWVFWCNVGRPGSWDPPPVSRPCSVFAFWHRARIHAWSSPLMYRTQQRQYTVVFLNQKVHIQVLLLRGHLALVCADGLKAGQPSGVVGIGEGNSRIQSIARRPQLGSLASPPAGSEASEASKD